MNQNTPLAHVFANYDGHIPYAFSEQFLATPDRAYDVVLEGVMHKIWHRPRWFKPLFWALGKTGILVSQSGQNIATTLEVIPGRFPDGTAYHEWNRTFAFEEPVHFNTAVVYDAKYENIADRVGPNHILHMVWDGKFTPPNTFTLDTISNALQIKEKIFYLPEWFWKLMLGRVKFRQQAHMDEPDLVDVDLRILHPIFGEIFGYVGTFRTVRYPKKGEPEKVYPQITPINAD